MELNIAQLVASYFHSIEKAPLNSFWPSFNEGFYSYSPFLFKVVR